MTEIYRSVDGRWVIERSVDRYLVYDFDRSEQDEVWSCTRLDQLYAWLKRQGLSVADFEETA